MEAESKKNKKRSIHFRKVRANRLLEVAEDYTELVFDYINAQGNVRVCDLAKEMGVSHVSVLKTVKRLVRDGYLTKDDEKGIGLTQTGQTVAAFSKKKHCTLTRFLLSLGVPEEITATDVEGIEHHISPVTLEAIITHMEKTFPKKSQDMTRLDNT